MSATDERTSTQEPAEQVKVPSLGGDIEATTAIPDLPGDVSKVPHKDRVRAQLARYLVFLLGAVVVGGLALVALSPVTKIAVSDVMDVVQVLFTALLTLVSSVLGFYFGTEHAKDKDHES